MNPSDKPSPAVATASAAVGSHEHPPTIPGYRIVRRLGVGGMASVWLAVQESLDREVAIKVIYPSANADPEQSRRFEQEARVIARLDHPHIVGIHEVGHAGDGRLYFAMPYLAGGDLSQRDFTHDEAMVLSILRALLEALAYAHARGIVHRDVKPENVLFDEDGRARLADFGIARSHNVTHRITGAGLTIGSGGFMAPEQARGDEVDGRADLYSVGVLAYELLTGELPYESTDPLTLALMHAHDPIPRLPGGTRHWQPFIDRALAKRPERRFRSAQAMLRALDRLEQGSGGGLRSALYVIARDPVWRSPWTQFAAGLALVALIVALTMASRPQRQVAVSAVPAPELPATLDEETGARALDLAQQQFAAGAIVAPSGANAAETWLGVLRLQPGNSEAVRGLGQAMNWLGERTAGDVASGDFESARARLEQARMLADAAGEALDADRARYLARVREALRGTDAAGEPEGAAALRAAIGETPPAVLPEMQGLAVPAAEPAAKAQAPAPLEKPVPEPTASAAQAGPAASASLVVSRAQFERFAEATGRGPARCHLAISLIRVFDRKDWRDPGFPQASGDPVVCVSHQDASAYAQWLSDRTGARWRLPSASEGAGKAGAFAAWTSDCAGKGGCSRRLAVGSGASVVARDPDRGYNDLGIRLVRDAR
ncbi:MAG TPA: bifunctional serine/threonine-protein kinase/formylglycine-generating enzyme family protein [Xanthomonadaceae bacterium]|nr:bifunctional serine/threonine-protein kinase/formylglycine-generating enzyme family protein [Xanthomonadaceae bacterium]